VTTVYVSLRGVDLLTGVSELVDLSVSLGKQLTAEGLSTSREVGWEERLQNYLSILFSVRHKASTQ